MGNNEIKKCFGASVKFWRNQMGISQEVLAQRADMDRACIYDVENGSCNASLEIIDKLAKTLRVSASALLLDRRGSGTPESGTRLIPEEEVVSILFVEDNPEDMALELLALKRANVANRIELARDGQEALDFLFCTGEFSSRQPDDLPQVIFLDLNLPKVDGMEVLRQIKAHPKTSSIPVVVLTGSSRSRDIAESRKLGAQAYIVKPVDFQNFSEVVRKLEMKWVVLKPMPGGKHLI